MDLLMQEEVRLGNYETFHHGGQLTETVWEKLMLGLSTRNYGHAIRQFVQPYFGLRVAEAEDTLAALSWGGGFRQTDSPGSS